MSLGTSHTSACEPDTEQHNQIYSWHAKYKYLIHTLSTTYVQWLPVTLLYLVLPLKKKKLVKKNPIA